MENSNNLDVIKRRTVLTYMQQISVYLLLLLMPTAVFWFFGRPSALGIYPLLAMPTWHLSDVAIAGLVVVSIGRFKIDVDKTWPIDLILLLLCTAAFITAFSAVVPYYAIYTAVRWSTAFIIYRILLEARLSERRMVGIFILGLGIQSVIGILQAVTQQPLDIPGETVQPYFHLWRAVGMTFHPNVFAGYLIVGLLLAIPLLGQKRFLPVWWLMWAAWLATASRSSAVALSMTLPVALAWFFWYRPSSRRTLLIALIGAFLTVSFLLSHGFTGLTRYYEVQHEAESAKAFEPASTSQVNLTTPPEVNDRPSTSDPSAPLTSPIPTPQPVQPSKTSVDITIPNETTQLRDQIQTMIAQNYAINYRLRLMEVAFGVLVARPWHGLGAGNFPLTMVGKMTENGPDNVHNVPLLLAAEVGILGGGMWLALIVLAFGWLLSHWQTANSWLIVGVCAWFALAGESLFEYYPWGLETGRLLTMFVWAIIGRNLSNTNDVITFSNPFYKRIQ